MRKEKKGFNWARYENGRDIFKEMMDDVESVDKMTGDPVQQG